MAQTLTVMALALAVAVPVLYLALAGHWKARERRGRAAPDDWDYELEQRAHRAAQHPEEHQ